MSEEGQKLFGSAIWELIDLGYVKKGNSMNQQQAWYDFLDDFPVVDEAMKWQSEYIYTKGYENLAAYYGSIYHLRSLFLGKMYQELEDEFGSGIWDKVTIYDAYRDAGLKDKAKAYKVANPDLKKYYDRRDELSPVITEAMVEFGEKLPEGEDMRLREDISEPSVIEQKIMDFVEGPVPKTYSRQEWIEFIGAETYAVARIAWRQANNLEDVPGDIDKRLREIAEDFNLSYEEFLISIGLTD